MGALVCGDGPDRTRDAGRWSGSRQVPLFYLDAHVQGISAEHATQVARDIVSGAGLFDTERVIFHITAMPADQAPPRAHHTGQSRVLTADLEPISAAIRTVFPM
jgi:hypothetical protein